MATADIMAQQVIQEFLFPVEPPRGRLERFDLVDGAHLPEALAIHYELARLQRSNLVAGVFVSEPLEIVGGSSRRSSGGVFIYQDGFVISAEGDRFLASVSGPGNRAEEARVNTLPEAIDFVIGVFHRRAQSGVR